MVGRDWQELSRFKRFFGINRRGVEKAVTRLEDPPEEEVVRHGLNRAALRRELRYLVVLFLTVVVLEIVVFWGYFSGALIPPWDFLGSYNTGAYAWWETGSFFNPAAWVPNSLAGYPAALSLQDSSWYLPVGIAALFGPFTLHSAAILASLHVALGTVGTYVLVRSLKMPFLASLFAAVAGFFAVGYFSNAQHVDIVRGFALVPWILLILSPRWPWRFVWAVPVATLFLWQAAMGIYPGMIVTAAYIGIVWVIVFQVRDRARLGVYILPLSLSALGAVLLSAPKFLPYFFISDDVVRPFADTSKFDLSLIGTLVFGYGHLQGPNDLSMNSFFVPATVLVLACFAKIRDRIVIGAIAIGVPALLIGMPFFPWFQTVQMLPGLGLSRFGMNDSKAFIILSAILLASSGLHRLTVQQSNFSTELSARGFWVRFGGAFSVVSVIFLLRKEGDFTRQDYLPGFFLLGVFLVLVALWRLGRKKLSSASFLAATIIITLAAGCVWAFTTPAPWSTPRSAAESSTYGATVDELLAKRSSRTAEVQRPARIGLPEGYDARVIFSPRWNGTYYEGRDALGGYVNIKSSETVMRMTRALLDPESGRSIATFLSAPGLVFVGDVTPKKLESCAVNDVCGQASTTPLVYKPGDLTYRISNPSAMTAVLNEAYYPGWKVTACHGEECLVIEPERSAMGVIQILLPAGSYELRAAYYPPGRDLGWLIFGVGLLLAAASVAIRTIRKSVESGMTRDGGGRHTTVKVLLNQLLQGRKSATKNIAEAPKVAGSKFADREPGATQ